jgi:cyanate permease
MLKLSFGQLAKIFAAGFLGYVLLLSLFSVGLAFLFPSFIKRQLDTSIDTFFETMFLVFGVWGILTTPIMLVGAWCVLRLLGLRRKTGGAHPYRSSGMSDRANPSV